MKSPISLLVSSRGCPALFLRLGLAVLVWFFISSLQQQGGDAEMIQSMGNQLPDL